LGCGLVMTGHALLTPLLQALMMLAADFVTMSRAADRAVPSAYPNVWRVRNLVFAAIPLGFVKLCYLMGVLAVSWYIVRLNPAQMQTLTFLTLALAGQANIYVLRERHHFWKSHPAPIMMVASGCDVVVVTGLALGGILMTELPMVDVAGVWLATIAFAFLFDATKLGVRARLRID
jgi:H+-transporting ATPase